MVGCMIKTFGNRSYNFKSKPDLNFSLNNISFLCAVHKLYFFVIFLVIIQCNYIQSVTIRFFKFAESFL